MVIVSHDREFLDQLCTKVVETEHGLATTYKCGTHVLQRELSSRFLGDIVVPSCYGLISKLSE